MSGDLFSAEDKLRIAKNMTLAIQLAQQAKEKQMVKLLHKTVFIELNKLDLYVILIIPEKEIVFINKVRKKVGKTGDLVHLNKRYVVLIACLNRY